MTRSDKHVHKFVVSKTKDGFIVVVIDDESEVDYPDQYHTQEVTIQKSGDVSIVAVNSTDDQLLVDFDGSYDSDLPVKQFEQNEKEIAFILDPENGKFVTPCFSTKVFSPDGKGKTTYSVSREELKARYNPNQNQRKAKLG